tara:strand:+ start:403 stop:762 length:360 start_codon:yes stop_codon:yes gene_type:complete
MSTMAKTAKPRRVPAVSAIVAWDPVDYTGTAVWTGPRIASVWSLTWRDGPSMIAVILTRQGSSDWYNHLSNMTPEFYDLFNNTSGRVGPPLERPTVEIRKFFHEWLDNDAAPALQQSQD